MHVQRFRHDRKPEGHHQQYTELKLFTHTVVKQMLQLRKNLKADDRDNGP